jgi:methionine-gamma-lyase
MANRYGLGTRSIHAGEAPDPTTGALGTPIYQNATYAFRSYDQIEAWREGMAPHFFYARDGNPTVRCLELKLADLEGAEAAVAAASGMAAISATLLHLLAGGGHLVASADVYSVAEEFLRHDLPNHGSPVTLVDITDLTTVDAAITPETRAIYTETFSNPTLRVADVSALAEIAHRRDIPLVVDNTFMTPALLRPLEHGADIVIHSATKYLAGHGQVLGGIVSGPRATIAAIARRLSRLGGAISPFASWLILGGVKTLPLRLERHATSAARLAMLLAAHPAVATVHYPGLPTHPGHDVARRLTGDRFGGMLSFTLRGGQTAVGPFLNSLKLCALAVSLGDTSTLIWPFSDTNLLRLSVGLEDLADLEADIANGLAAIDAVHPRHSERSQASLPSFGA